MGDPLKNPPLIEAMCEFRFDPESEWDWTIPGRIFEKIGDEFSERGEVHRLGITVNEGGDGAPKPTVIQGGPDRIQFKRADGTAIVQAGPRLLSINHLRPYRTWEDFRDLVLRMYDTYVGVSGSHPLHRIGLRYINHLPLPPIGQELHEMLTTKPNLSGRLDRKVTSFFQRYALQHDDPPGILIHQTGLQRSDDDPIVTLDLDFYSQEVRGIGSGDALGDWLDRAHARVEEAFIDSLNAEAYERLKRGEE